MRVGSASPYWLAGRTKAQQGQAVDAECLGEDIHPKAGLAKEATSACLVFTLCHQ